MTRALIVVGLVLAAFLAVGATVGWLAYGPAPTRDGTLAVPGLGADVSVAWPDSGGVAIEAQSWPDAAAALGYAHAADDTFALALWRQSARGETAAWFGDSARAVDLHARQLGFDALARQTYERLDAPTRALFDGYARGVNAALAQPAVAQSDAFVWLGQTPEPWQPWDAIAVERLVAYLGAPRLDADSAFVRASRATPAVARFVRADALMRARLGLDGLGFARAFAAQARGGTAVVAHQPAGESTLALFVPVAFRVAGRSVAAASVPGTLALPAGTDGASAWSVFLTSTLTVEPFDGDAPLLLYSRVVDRDGDETLVSVARDSSGLVLGPAPRASRRATPVVRDSLARDTLAARPAEARIPRPVIFPAALAADSAATDSAVVPRAWRVRWAGFRLGTDASAFASLLQQGTPAPFRLFDGDGLFVGREGARALGRPRVVAPRPTSVLVSGDAAARWASARLDTLAARGAGLTAQALADDAQSRWASARLPPMLRALGPRDSIDQSLVNANAFLRSWDGVYSADAIAPSIFEAWLAAHLDFTGHLPDPADSADVALLPFTLRIARGELRDAYGPDESGWRWGTLRARTRTPVLGSLGGTPGRRYADALAGPGGHPTALRPGPALLYDDALANQNSTARADSTARPRDTRLGAERLGAERPFVARSAGPAVWSAWTTMGGARLFVRGPGRAGESFRPVDAAFGDPGVTVEIDARAPLPSRRLVLTPAR